MQTGPQETRKRRKGKIPSKVTQVRIGICIPILSGLIPEYQAQFPSYSNRKISVLSLLCGDATNLKLPN